MALRWEARVRAAERVRFEATTFGKIVGKLGLSGVGASWLPLRKRSLLFLAWGASAAQVQAGRLRCRCDDARGHRGHVRIARCGLRAARLTAPAGRLSPALLTVPVPMGPGCNRRPARRRTGRAPKFRASVARGLRSAVDAPRAVEHRVGVRDHRAGRRPSPSERGSRVAVPGPLRPSKVPRLRSSRASVTTGLKRSGAGVEPTEPWATRPHWF